MLKIDYTDSRLFLSTTKRLKPDVQNNELRIVYPDKFLLRRNGDIRHPQRKRRSLIVTSSC